MTRIAFIGAGSRGGRQGRAFYAAHRRFFETGYRGIEHPQYPVAGRWLVDAVDLPPAVLAKPYRENARRLLRR